MTGIEREGKRLVDPIPDRSSIGGMESAPAQRTTSFRARIDCGEESNSSPASALLRLEARSRVILVNVFYAYSRGALEENADDFGCNK